GAAGGSAGERGCGNAGGQNGGSRGDGLSGEGSAQSCRGEGDAALFEQPLEFVQGTIDAFTGGLFGSADGLADGAEVPLLEEAKDNGHAIFRAELVDSLVEDGGDRGEFVSRLILDGIHFNSLLFTELTAALRAHGFAGDKAGVAMEPAAELNIGGKRAGHAGEVCKDGRGDILGQTRVLIDETDIGGIGRIKV